MAALTLSYRLAVASRVIAAILGGYALTSLATFALARLLPLSKSEASMTATLLSFFIYACVVIWAFAARSAWRAWGSLVAAAFVLGAALWLHD